MFLLCLWCVPARVPTRRADRHAAAVRRMRDARSRRRDARRRERLAEAQLAADAVAPPVRRGADGGLGAAHQGHPARAVRQRAHRGAAPRDERADTPPAPPAACVGSVVIGGCASTGGAGGGGRTGVRARRAH